MLSSKTRGRTPRDGFTLVELLVALLVLSAVIIAILALFDSTNQLAKSQLNRVDLQQSLRVSQREIGRTIRLAGRGGLPAGSPGGLTLPTGMALSVVNNVPANYDILDNGSSPEVVENSDVLIVRGVIDTPVYLVEYPNPASFIPDPGGAPRGTVEIRRTTPIGNVDQDLSALVELINAGHPEALILASPFSEEVFGVAEIDYSTTEIVYSTTTGDPDSVTLGFRYAGNPRADAYALLSSNGAFPDVVLSQSRVGSVGVLEEYRFYLRSDPDGDDLTLLSWAQTYPGFAEAYAGDSTNLEVDIAENVIDFQVALAFDTHDEGDPEYGKISETPDGEADPPADEWYLNAGTDSTNAKWDPWLAGVAPRLRAVRLTTLGRSAQIDRGRVSPELSRLEDHYFSTTDPLNTVRERRYQRTVLRTIVKMRNL